MKMDKEKLEKELVMFINSQTVQQTGEMKIIYDSEGNAHYFPKHAHNCRVFKIIRNQNKAED